MIIVSLWCWRQAPDLAGQSGAANAKLAICSIRFAAIAGLASAQFPFLILAVANVFQRSGFDDVIRRAILLVLAVSLVCAVAFGLMAR